MAYLSLDNGLIGHGLSSSAVDWTLDKGLTGTPLNSNGLTGPVSECKEFITIACL